jgi:RimJ/RimL family protein N-acetyltransferase
MPVVLTERLVLTPVAVADVDDLVTLHGDPNVAHWYGRPWTEHQARRWADDMSALWAEQGVGMWMARLRGSCALVGRGGLLDRARTPS